MASIKNPYIQKAYKNLEEISADEEKRLEYEAREKAIRDHNYFMRMSKQTGWDEGLEHGREEGISALIRTCQDFRLTSSDTVTRLCQMFSISPEAAREYIQKYWDDKTL